MKSVFLGSGLSPLRVCDGQGASSRAHREDPGGTGGAACSSLRVSTRQRGGDRQGDSLRPRQAFPGTTAPLCAQRHLRWREGRVCCFSSSSFSFTSRALPRWPGQVHCGHEDVMRSAGGRIVTPSSRPCQGVAVRERIEAKGGAGRGAATVWLERREPDVPAPLHAPSLALSTCQPYLPAPLPLLCSPHLCAAPEGCPSPATLPLPGSGPWLGGGFCPRNASLSGDLPVSAAASAAAGSRWSRLLCFRLSPQRPPRSPACLWEPTSRCAGHGLGPSRLARSAQRSALEHLAWQPRARPLQNK